jgi:hypothetical protein
MIFFKKPKLEKKKKGKKKDNWKTKQKSKWKVNIGHRDGKVPGRRQERFFFLRIKDGGVHPLKLSNLFVS